MDSDAVDSSRVPAGLGTFTRYVPVPMKYPGEIMENKTPWTLVENAFGV
jgi:hypothetical protein